VADALAPQGIPNEMLLEALAPVNLLLKQASVDTEWMAAQIEPDMAITANGRPYQLLSESEQWRVDAMVAQVVAEISGLKVLMLDRVDVLDLPGRAQLLDWMDVLAFDGIIDTALLFGTFKAMPTGLADTITAFWVENGAITASTTVDGTAQQAA
jgi:ABC-type hemin transport system ATPase subunit